MSNEIEILRNERKHLFMELRSLRKLYIDHEISSIRYYGERLDLIKKIVYLDNLILLIYKKNK